MRLAWFSPLPPEPSGIAAYTHEVVPLLGHRVRTLDLYTDPGSPHKTSASSASSAAPPSSASSAFEFAHRHRRHPYDLVVYQLGNSAAHDFMWAYLFRYPGLLVLHDAQVHQARALWLLGRLEPRLSDYLAEVRANHPGQPADLGYLFAAGLGGDLFRLWPLVRLVLGRSRLTAVHNPHLARSLRDTNPDAAITSIEMGVADPMADRASLADDARAIRERAGIPAHACVVGAYGGITPEKRIPQLLEAVACQHGGSAPLHVLLVGQPAGHYDVAADIERLGIGSRVHRAGYVPDGALPGYLAAADICWCLRWPSNGETSASWLRCLGAAKPTLITALAQLQDVPTLALGEGAVASGGIGDAVGIAVDPVDDLRETARALHVLGNDVGLRQGLGSNARRYWESRHTLPRMADAYERIIIEAATRPVPALRLPAHLLDDGSGTAHEIVTAMGLSGLPW